MKRNWALHWRAQQCVLVLLPVWTFFFVLQTAGRLVLDLPGSMSIKSCLSGATSRSFVCENAHPVRYTTEQLGQRQKVSNANA